MKKLALVLALAAAPALFPTRAARADAPAAPAAATRTAQFTVNMHCSCCAGKVKAALGKIAGVHAVHIDLDKKLVDVTYDAGKTTEAALQKAIEGAGFKVSASA